MTVAVWRERQTGVPALAHEAVDFARAQAGQVGVEDEHLVGATRNRWIDGAVLWLLAATLAGVMGHGLLRLTLAAWRRRRP